MKGCTLRGGGMALVGLVSLSEAALAAILRQQTEHATLSCSGRKYGQQPLPALI